MSSLALALVILAAFLHASWNLLAKRAASAGPVFVLAYSGIASAAYLPWGVWLLRNEGMNWDSGVTACIILSGALHLAYSLFLQRGYQVADLTVVYPIARGSAPLLSTVGAFLLLRERPSAWSLLGLSAIVVGIGLISTEGNLTLFRSSTAHKGVWWGAGTGAMIAAYTVVDAYGVKVLAIHPVVLDCGANIIRLLVLLPWLFPRRLEVARRLRDSWVLAVAVGVLSPLSYILVLFALRLRAPLSLVAPAREMSMMVSALLGMLILRERVTPGRLAGCLLLLVGVIALGRA